MPKLRIKLNSNQLLDYKYLSYLFSMDRYFRLKGHSLASWGCAERWLWVGSTISTLTEELTMRKMIQILSWRCPISLDIGIRWKYPEWVKIPENLVGNARINLSQWISTSTSCLPYNYIWAASSEFGTYRLCEQRRFRRAGASSQSRQNLRCSLIQEVSQAKPSDRKPDPWPLWMAGHAQLKFVMTECSKTQIRLTGLI